MDITQITDIKELKAIKSDNYDMIEQSKKQIDVSTRNINALNARIEEILKETEEKPKEK